MEKIKLNSRNWVSIQMRLADVLIKEAMADSRTFYKEQIPDTIYHYTSLNGLIGIVESQSLFASNLYYLNDRKEYRHGIDLVLEVVKELKNENPYFKILEKIEENIHLFNESERYVTCFSLNGDLLSQWRAYGNDGKGIAIGFNRANIDDGCFSQHLQSYLMLYDEEDQKYNIERQITLILKYFEDIKEHIDWQDFDPNFLIAEAIIGFLEKTIGIYKHPSFKDEKEYRMEYELDGKINKSEDEKLNFRATTNLIVPFIKLTTRYQEAIKDNKEIEEVDTEPTYFLKTIPIDNIIVGPSLEFSSLKESIEKLLRRNGYKDVTIIESKVPYRI